MARERKSETKVYLQERLWLLDDPSSSEYVSAQVSRERVTHGDGSHRDYWITCLELGDGQCKAFHHDLDGIEMQMDEAKVTDNLRGLARLIRVLTEYSAALELALADRRADPESEEI